MKKIVLNLKTNVRDIIHKLMFDYSDNIDRISSNKQYVINVEYNENIEKLKYYIRDCINFFDGHYQKTIYSKEKEFKYQENEVNYVFDKYFTDDIGRYFLIIINNREGYFSPTSLKIYFITYDDKYKII